MAHYTGSSAEGSKARTLAAEREKQAEMFKSKQDDIKRQNQVKLTDMNDAFQSRSMGTEEQFKASTVGLVSAEEYKRKRLALEEADKLAEAARLKAQEKEKLRKGKERKEQRKALSFSMDDEEEAVAAAAAAPAARGEKRKDPSANGTAAAAATSDASTAAAASASSVVPAASPSAANGASSGADSASSPSAKRAKSNKDPTADTSFLPDRARDAEEAAMRLELEEEWKEAQEHIKKEQVQITYSYWDGSGHRNRLTIEKGASIAQFLEKARKSLSSEFHELRGLGPEGLIYIKEDLMIPQHYTFYQLIVSKARGKSGPLFHFDVHDDVRLSADASLEKDESHAGKIVTRAYYERNKNNFPASRWEVYDPAVIRDKYTIKGGEVRGTFAK